MTSIPLSIVVFSFNRGVFLEHCVRSIERHAPDAQVMVVDDMSTEPYTCSVLESIASRHKVLTPVDPLSDNPKVGGLYNNMQLALDTLPNGRLFCFMQEDMQLVRDLRDTDVQAIHDHFERHPKAGTLNCTFRKGYRREREQQSIYWDEASNCYFRHPPEKGWGAYFAAVFTGRVDRLRAVNWQFANREKLNDALVGQHFEPMGQLRHPFMMFLPATPVYRARKKTLALQLAEKQARCGFYPYRPLEGDRLEQFLNRDPSQIPFAEDWLETEPVLAQKPWSWGPFQNSYWLRKLNKIETALGALTARLSTK